jgi:hypothetical protein
MSSGRSTDIYADHLQTDIRQCQVTSDIIAEAEATQAPSPSLLVGVTRWLNHCQRLSTAFLESAVQEDVVSFHTAVGDIVLMESNVIHRTPATSENRLLLFAVVTDGAFLVDTKVQYPIFYLACVGFGVCSEQHVHLLKLYDPTLARLPAAVKRELLRSPFGTSFPNAVRSKHSKL